MIRIRKALSDDAATLHSLVAALAEYEHLAHELTATVEDIHGLLAGEQPAMGAFLAFADAAPAGMATFYRTVSTFRGKCGIFLEDIFVREPYRRSGIGTMLLRAVAREALDVGSPRLEWLVLGWNTPAIDFYTKIGATLRSEWRVERLAGEPLARLATVST